MRQEGVVLISLLVFLLLMSLGAALELPGVVEERNRALEGSSETRLAAASVAAEDHRIAGGSFPTDLDALGGGANLPPRWRLDPFEPAEDMDLVDAGDRLELRHRGEDLVLATADDRVEVRSDRVSGRARTRNRLRLYRAVMFTSDRFQAKTMSAAEQAELRALWDELWPAMRRRVYEAAADRAATEARIAAIRARIAEIQKGHKVKNVPGNARGLLAILKLPVQGDLDGFGRRLEVDDLGFYSAGRDGVGGTDDDF
ncbi:MAG: hypothetical protein R3F30_04910 [Planctomycetota bacterium]